MKLRYERGARSDLEEIFAYVARDNRKAATQLVDRIEWLVARISEQPYMGEPTREPHFRQLPIGNYLIVYEVGEGEVIIHYVRHGARKRPWKV